MGPKGKGLIGPIAVENWVGVSRLGDEGLINVLSFCFGREGKEEKVRVNWASGPKFQTDPIFIEFSPKQNDK